MKSTRRILALVLCLLMCMALFPLSASAAGSIQSSGTCGAGLEFVIYNDGELVINGTGSILPMSQWSFTGGQNFAQDDVLATKAEIKTLVIEEGATQIMDTVFMFWAIVNGIICGAGFVLITVIACLVIGVLILVVFYFGKIAQQNLYLVVVRSKETVSLVAPRPCHHSQAAI